LLIKIKWKFLLIGLLGWGLISFWAAAFGDEFQEDQVKVAFLYNFSKFIEWPADAFKSDTTPIGIYVLGVDPLGPVLDALREKTVKGRRIVIRRISRLENLDECHILFISGSERGNVKSLLAFLKNHPILTVSDIDRFAPQGGMIGLVNVEEKINFEVNLDTVYHSRLKFSAQLLKLAKIVRSGS
jgi:hypothetical protein